MTYELTYGVLWIIGAAFFAIHTVWKLGGLMSSGSMIVMFVILFFSSTNVLASTSAGLISTNNPMAGWLALFMAVASTLVFLFIMLGLAGYGEDEQDEEAMESITDIAERV